MKHYLHILSILLVVALLCLFPACKKEPVPDPPDIPANEAHITDSVRYNADHMTAYNFVYPSTDPYGNPVMLSGTITLGDSVTRHRPAKGLLLYNHFTVYRADQCPTRGDLSIQKIMARGPSPSRKPIAFPPPTHKAASMRSSQPASYLPIWATNGKTTFSTLATRKAGRQPWA